MSQNAFERRGDGFGVAAAFAGGGASVGDAGD
jgi:hypothetical protein